MRRLEEGTIALESAGRRIEHLRRVVGGNMWLDIYPDDESQTVAAVFCLLCQAEKMTMFDNQDRESFSLVRKILESHLPDYTNNTHWRQLVKRKSPIGDLSMAECTQCGRTWPLAGVGEFQYVAPLFCERCGDMAIAPLTLKDSQKGGLHWAPGISPKQLCRCGGHFIADSNQCPDCGSAEITETPVSPYEYFQTHEWYHIKSERRYRR